MQTSSPTCEDAEAPTLPWIVMRLCNHYFLSEHSAYPELQIHANSSGFRLLAQELERFANQCDSQDASPTPHGASTTTSVTIEPGVPISVAGLAIRECLSDRLGVKLLHLPRHEQDLWIKTWCAGLGDHRCVTRRYPELTARARSELDTFCPARAEDADRSWGLDSLLLSPDEALRRLAHEVPDAGPLYGLEVLRRHDGRLSLSRSHSFREDDERNPWEQAIALLKSIREQDVLVAFVPLRSTPRLAD
jgi:hypothetical protein